jgi:putative sigma-54 modulation protein
MQVTVSSRRQTEVSEALRASAVEKIGRLERFLDGMDRAEVHFSEQKSRRVADREVCEVTMEGHGHVVRCKVAAADAFAAVDLAVEKLEQQLHRLKTRVKRTSQAKGGRARKGLDAARRDQDGAILVDEDDPDRSMADDAYVTRAGELVVKKKSFAIAPVSVDDAVLQMELIGHSFYFFTNAATGKAAVLYRRDDGKLGLIDQA